MPCYLPYVSVSTFHKGYLSVSTVHEGYLNLSTFHALAGCVPNLALARARMSESGPNRISPLTRAHVPIWLDQ